jgi:hypothetical protein
MNHIPFTEQSGTDARELNRVRNIHRRVAMSLAELAGGFWQQHQKFACGYLPTGETCWWSREEVLAWPERKAAMVAHVNTPQLRHLNVAWTEPGSTLFVSDKLTGGDRDCAPAVARGLCIYSDMLTGLEPAGPAHLTPKTCELCDAPASARWALASFTVPEADLCDACANVGSDVTALVTALQRRRRDSTSATPPGDDQTGELTTGGWIGAAYDSDSSARAPTPIDPYANRHAGTYLETDKEQRANTDLMSRNETARARNIAALRLELDRPASILEQAHPREWFSGRNPGRRRL